MRPELVKVNARARSRIKEGHPWIFRQEVLSGPNQDARDGGPALVEVVDERGRPLAIAMWANASPIALRIIDLREHSGPIPSLVEVAVPRIERAIARRTSLALDRDAFRVVHGESDDLPGLFVDRYADTAVLQTSSVAMNAHRSELAVHIQRLLAVRLVVIRDDGSARDFEGLPRIAEVALGQGSTKVVYRLGENRLETDLLNASKTGGFLDQADNHALVAGFALPGARCLDAFTAHGGFALALARKGGPVLATDEEEQQVRYATANAQRNGLSNLTVRQANAFELLRSLEAARERFDVVVLDPPAFAKRKSSEQAAQRAYHEIMLRGLRLTAADGLAVFCSCSGRIFREDFDRLITHAASDSGRHVQVLMRLGAGRDHPERVGLPETGHLKCWILRVL
jgi:23S rRNA (cytosine1962-C5)-methyltransferase